MYKTDRIDGSKASPEAMRALFNVEKYLHTCGIEPALAELVRVRASQINKCAHCIDNHRTKARGADVTDRKLLLLSAWQEASIFSARERAALRWTDWLTQIDRSEISDQQFTEMRQHFTDKELTDLTTMIGMINTWNRLSVAFGYQYQPQ